MYMDKLTYYKLYIKSKKLTKGFKEINLDLIKKEQRSLVILRSILNINQRNFSKYLGISKSYLWALENNLNDLLSALKG